MNTIKRLSACLLASSVLTALPQIAQAQIEDEIIVTATKRATSVQDVPLAVTAVSPAQLENQGVTSIKDLSNVAAGFNIQSSQTENQGTSIRIRGIGTTGNNIGLESAVGVFVDGVYQSRPGIALGEMVDIASLELLRGPQGTLFGRNTTAGALNIRTTAPDFDGTSGFANFTYGNYDMMQVQGGINLTASEQLAFRLTGSHHTRDGFMKSATTPGAESHDRDRFLLKAQALWEPTDMTSLRIIGNYQESDENCCAAATITTSPNLAANPTLRDSTFAAVGFEDSVEAYRFNSAAFKNGTDQKGISAELVHDFGGIEMTLIGAYNDFVGDNTQDDFNGAEQYSVVSSDAVETLTAELRFQGEAMDGKLDWLVGGFYADEQIEENQVFTMGTDFGASVGLANFGSPAALGTIAAAGVYLVNGNDPTIFGTGVEDGGNFARNQFKQDANSLSIFTHNIFAVTDNINLTVGARYIDDSKDGSFEQLEVNNPYCSAGLPLLGAVTADTVGPDGLPGTADDLALAPNVFATFQPILGNAGAGLVASRAAVQGGAFLNCFPFIAPAIGEVTGIPFLPQEFDDNFSDEEFIYTIGADTKLGADTLLFGSYSHGYKAGGFNLDATAASGGGDPRFASEEIDSWELGIKTTLGDRIRFNVTGFWSTMDNFQVLEFTGSKFETFNVDEASSKGVELEINGRLSDYVSTNIGVTYADASYGDDCDRGGTIPQASRLCGSDLTNAPKISSVLGVTYDGPLTDSGWGLLANVNLQTVSDKRTSTQPLTAAGDLNPFDIQPGTTKVNARLGFKMPNEQVSLEFWGTNITDVTTRGITFNTPLQGASRSAFLDAPRQYGATVRAKF